MKNRACGERIRVATRVMSGVGLQCARSTPWKAISFSAILSAFTGSLIS